MSEIGSGYTGGDYLSSDFYNDTVPSHDKSKVDSPSGNKNRVKADHVNDLGAEVVGIATRIGAGARGSQTDIKARLDRGQNSYGDPGGRRQTLGYDTFDAALKNNGSVIVAGIVEGEPGKTETVNQVEFGLVNNVEIRLPHNHKIDWNKTDNSDVKMFEGISKTDFYLDGGEFDMNSTGAAAENSTDTGILLAAKRSLLRITGSSLWDRARAAKRTLQLLFLRDRPLERGVHDM